MAQVADNLAQNESVEVATRRNVMWVSAQTGPANHAGADITIEASWDAGANFYQLELIDPAEVGTPIETLVGASKAGYARCPGADAVRARRTDANGGTGIVNLTTVPLR